MDTAVLTKIVNGPLHFPQWRGVVGNFDIKGWAPTILSAAVFVMGAIYWTGGFTSGQSRDIQSLQAQYHELSIQLESVRTQIAPLALLPAQLARLQSTLDAAPRSDLMESRLSEIQRHLSALDGRLDGDEKQQRTDEDRSIEGLAQTRARLDAIDSASKAALGNHR